MNGDWMVENGVGRSMRRFLGHGEDTLGYKDLDLGPFFFQCNCQMILKILCIINKNCWCKNKALENLARKEKNNKNLVLLNLAMWTSCSIIIIMHITTIWVRLTWLKAVFDYNSKSYSWLVVLVTRIPLYQSTDTYLSPIM